jgi:uncharacterized phiE125 gp8 family phage protein
MVPAFPGAVLDAARDAISAHLRISGDVEDALIARLAASALGLCEAYTGRALIARDWSETMPAAPAWRRLAAAPVTAIAAVEGWPVDGEAFALPADGYAVDIDGDGVGWVRVTAPVARARVHFTAGLATEWSAVPAPIAHGVVLLAAHLFEQRGDAVPPAAVAALWRPWRQLRLRVPACSKH